MPVAAPLIAGAAATAGAGAAGLFGATAAFGAGSLFGTFAGAVIGGVVSLATSAAVGAMSRPSNPDATGALDVPGAGRTQQVRQPTAPHQFHYGTVKTSGVILFVHVAEDEFERTFGNLYMIIAIAGGRIKAIRTVYADDDLVTDAKFVFGVDPPRSLIRIGKHLGSADQVADADLVAEIPEVWTVDHRGRGRAYMAVRLTWDSVLLSAIPNISSIIDGCDEIYDPRNGVTGFTNNAALCIAHWLTSPVGMNLARSKIDEPTLIASANVCDERVRVGVGTTTAAAEVAAGSPTLYTGAFTLGEQARTLEWGDGVRFTTSGTLPAGFAVDTTYYAIPEAGGKIRFATTPAAAIAGSAITVTSAGSGTHTLTYWDEARYKCNGTFTLDMQKRDVLEQLLTSMAGVRVRRGSKWFLYAGAAADPTVTLTADDLRGNLTITPKRSMRDRCNGVRAVFVNPDNKWQPSDAPPLQPTAALLAEDGGEELYEDIRLPFTTSARCAQRLMKIYRERSRRQRMVEFAAKLTAMRLAPWDGMYLTIDRGDGTVLLDAAQHRVTSWKLAEDGGIDLTLQEDDADVYAWSASDEQNVALPQGVDLPDPSSIAAPATLKVNTPGVPTFTKLYAEWAAVNTIFFDGYDLEHRAKGVSEWTGYGRVTSTRKADVTRNGPTDFRVRAVALNGATSAWTENFAPGPPTEVTVTEVDEVIIGEITWVNDPDAVTIQLFKDGSLFNNSIDATDEVISDLDDGAYQLRSVNAAGNISALSPTVTITGVGSGDGGGDGSDGGGDGE